MTRHHVSIGLPVRNAAAHLPLTLDALLSQTYDDFEVILCDNGSTDATEAICRDAVRRDPRVRYYRSPNNMGLAANYDRAFSHARGSLFRWNTADDLCDRTHLERLVAALESAGDDAVLAHPLTMLVDRDGAILGEHGEPIALDDDRPHRRLRAVLDHADLCSAAYGLIRRDRLARTGRVGNLRGALQVLLAELALHGRFVEVPATLLRRRVNDTGATGFSAEQLATWFDASYGGRPESEASRHLAALRRAVLRAPLGLVDRSRCLATLCGTWIPRHWKALGRELVDAVRQRPAAPLAIDASTEPATLGAHEPALLAPAVRHLPRVPPVGRRAG